MVSGTKLLTLPMKTNIQHPRKKYPMIIEMEETFRRKNPIVRRPAVF